MDGELVTDTPSNMAGGDKSSSPVICYTDTFREQFPFYLSIGMTFEQYWDGDCCLAKYYREAQELRNDRRNQELWLQGLYIYEAIADLSPILHAFAKKGTKPQPYLKEPIPLTKREAEDKAEREEKIKSENAMRKMESYMAVFNKKFKQKECDVDNE